MFYILAKCSEQDLMKVFDFVKLFLRMVQFIVPVILIVLGTIDLVKAVIASKEDEIKNAQKMLIKRLIYAVIVFLVPFIVSWIMGLIGNNDWKDCWNEARPKVENLFKVDAEL